VAGSRSARRGDHRDRTGVSRMVRVNELVRQVLAEELAGLIYDEHGLEAVSVTGVDTRSDLSAARVFLSSLPEALREILDESRPQLQGALARQVRLKRVPRLLFEVDPAAMAADAVESALARIRQPESGLDPRIPSEQEVEPPPGDENGRTE
jgi:ribosome-binding factor A